jgi:hypothetical protein
MNTGIPERFTDEDGELAEPLSREEVEDLFSPGTVVLSRGRAYHVDELLSGPELLGTVEDDDSLWVTTEEGGTALVVGNALHSLVSGPWTYARDPEEVYEEWVECDECGIYRRPGGVVGEFVPGASFCSEDCRDTRLDRETGVEEESA